MPFRLVSSPAEAVLIFINLEAGGAATSSAAEAALGFKNKKETVLKVRQSPKMIEITSSFFIYSPFSLNSYYNSLPFANSLTVLYWEVRY
jgi:hypothetical protein